MANEEELVELKIALKHFKEFNRVFANEYDVDPDCYLSTDEVQMAISALEKQISIMATFGGSYAINEWECPNCKSYFANINSRPRYCCECGQAISWKSEKSEIDDDYKVLPYVSEPNVTEGEGCFFTRDEWK